MLESLPQGQEDLADYIRRNLISPGKNQTTGPYRVNPYIYTDWTASGQSLSCIEDYLRFEVLPYYANTHTESSFAGQQMAIFRESSELEAHLPRTPVH